jgi:hypothetical protein
MNNPQTKLFAQDDPDQILRWQKHSPAATKQ